MNPTPDQPLCDHCKQPFHRKRRWQVYCSTNCRVLAFYHREHPNAQKLEDLAWYKRRFGTSKVDQTV